MEMDAHSRHAMYGEWNRGPCILYSLDDKIQHVFQSQNLYDKEEGIGLEDRVV